MKTSIHDIAFNRLLEGVREKDLEHIYAVYHYHKHFDTSNYHALFEEMREGRFFSNKSEEDEYKKLPPETKTFYYLEFKKFKPYIIK